jgi:hypothetical protein
MFLVGNWNEKRKARQCIQLSWMVQAGSADHLPVTVYDREVHSCAPSITWRKGGEATRQNVKQPRRAQIGGFGCSSTAG